MHELKKIGFLSKYHWAESLKKVSKHDFPFYTVEERFKIWSRAAYQLLIKTIFPEIRITKYIHFKISNYRPCILAFFNQMVDFQDLKRDCVKELIL